MNTGILDKPIAFHRCFVTLTGSVNAALMLSQAVYWQKRNKDGDWWFQTQEKWEDETGLTRREQETARKLLRGLPFWSEELRGLPGKLHFKVDLDALLESVFATTSSKTSMAESAKQHCTTPPNSIGETSHTSNKEKRLIEETYVIPPSAEKETKPKLSKAELESKALEIYKTYPRKVGKVKALQAIIKALQSHEFDYLLGRAAKYAQCVTNWPQDQLCYVPHPSTWFNGGRFEDDEREWVKNAPAETFTQMSQRAFAIRSAIQSHVANREYIGSKDDPTDAEIAQLRGLRAQLLEVENKMALSK